MHSLNIAVATQCLGLPFQQAVLAASGIGVTGVQLDARHEVKPSELSATGRRHLLHQLDELNLRIASIDFPARRAYYDAEQLEERVAATKAAMELAYELQARVLTGRVGRIPTDAESNEYRLLRDVLNDLARHGNRVGTTFVITPTNDSPEALAKLIAQVDQGPIGINHDPARFVMAGHDANTAFRSLFRSVAHVVARDAVRDVDGSLLEVPVGRGDVAWDEFLVLLGEADYRGWLTVDRTSGDDKRGDVTRAVQYLRHVAMET